MGRVYVDPRSLLGRQIRSGRTKSSRRRTLLMAHGSVKRRQRLKHKA